MTDKELVKAKELLEDAEEKTKFIATNTKDEIWLSAIGANTNISQVLALLEKQPCKTCGGSGQVGEEESYYGRSIGYKSCPDCQQSSRKVDCAATRIGDICPFLKQPPPTVQAETKQPCEIDSDCVHDDLYPSMELQLKMARYGHFLMHGDWECLKCHKWIKIECEDERMGEEGTKSKDGKYEYR
ncbi:unnamed protein product, partial [marine sediment metagenome]